MSSSNPPTASDRQGLALLTRLASALRCCRQEVFCEGLTFPQFLILDLAAREPGLAPARVGRELGVDKSTATRQIKPLLANGLLKREGRPGDGRVAALLLTPAGEETLGRVWDCVALFLRGVRGRLPRGRQREIMTAVDIFLRAMDQTWGTQCCGLTRIGEQPHER